MQTGDTQAPNPEEARTAARIYNFEAALGLWRGLGLRIGLPVLETEYRNSMDRGHEADVGDLWFRLGYTYVLNRKQGWFRVAGGLGLSLPTGGRLAAELPSNSGFASRTVNPLAQLDLSYDFRFGLGLFLLGDARWVPYANDGKQAGSSIIYGGGLRFQLFKRLFPSVGVFGLHRLADQVDSAPMPNSGIHAVYVAVSLTYAFRYKPLRGLSLFTTLMIPTYQYARGTQLVEALDVTVGLRYSFSAWKPRKPAPPATSPTLPEVAGR